MTAKSGYTSSTVTTYGTTGSYLDIQGKELAYGRFLKAADIDNHSNVVVLNEDAATEIIGRANAVGESISLDGRSFLIIGIVKSDETSSNPHPGQAEVPDLAGAIPHLKAVLPAVHPVRHIPVWMPIYPIPH